MKQIAQLILAAMIIAFGVYVFKCASSAIPHHQNELRQIVDASN